MLRRRSKLLVIKKANVSTATSIATTGFVPVISFGVRVLGMPDSLYNITRKTVAATLLGKSAGRSATLGLAIAGKDPGPPLGGGGMMAWATLWWNGDVPERVLHAAWNRAFKRAEVAGPDVKGWKGVGGGGRDLGGRDGDRVGWGGDFWVSARFLLESRLELS